MSQTVDATFDGEVFRPAQAIALQPDTQVQLIVTVKSADQGHPSSFLRVARSLKLSGPADWSVRLDDYLYGEATSGDSR